MKEKLRVTGILNIAFASLYFILTIFGGIFPFICFLILIVSGIFFLDYSRLDDVNSKKNIIMWLSILCIPVLLVSALINLIGLSKISNNIDANAPNIDPSTKKIDVLIKLGISLIVLSMIIFVTTGWNTISRYIVIILLSVLTLIFYLLHLLFTKKIILNSSSKLYFILYNIFLIIIFYSMGYYNMFGKYFSPNGYGSYLFNSVLLLISSFVTYAFKKITNSNMRIYVMEILITLSLYNLLLFFEFSTIDSLVIINILTLFIRFKIKKDYIIKYTDVLMKLFIFITGLSLLNGYSISLMLLVIINLVVVNILNLKDKSILLEILSPVVTFLYSGVSIGLIVNNYDMFYEQYILMFLAVCSILYILLLLTRLFDNKKVSKLTFTILYNLIFLVFTVNSFFLESSIVLIIFILRLTMIFGTYFFEFRHGIKSLEYYLLPLNLSLTYIGLLMFIGDYISLSLNVVLISLMVLFSVYYYIVKNEVLEWIIYAFIIFINVINIISSLFDSNIFIISLTLVSSILPIFLLTLKKKNVFIKSTFLYSLIASYFVLLNSEFEIVVSFILNIILYLLVFIIVYNNKEYRKMSLLLINLPIITLLIRLDINSDLKMLLINIILMETMIYSLVNYVSNVDVKRVLFVIFTTILFLLIMFIDNVIFGIYIGIICLFLVIYSSIKDNKVIFNFSLIVFIINIIYRLRSVWELIPFWVYLLVAGITIVVVATIIELKKNKK